MEGGRAEYNMKRKLRHNINCWNYQKKRSVQTPSMLLIFFKGYLVVIRCLL